MYIIYIYTIYKSNTLHGIIRGQKCKNTGTSCIQPSYALWMEFCKENGVIHGSSLRHLLFTYVSLECIYTYNL